MKKITSTLVLSTILVSALSAASEPVDPIKDRCSRFIRSYRTEGQRPWKSHIYFLAARECEKPIVQFLLGGISRGRYRLSEVDSFIESFDKLLDKFLPEKDIWRCLTVDVNEGAACFLEERCYPEDTPLTYLVEKKEIKEAFFKGKVGADILEACQSGELQESDLYALDIKKNFTFFEQYCELFKNH